MAPSAADVDINALPEWVCLRCFYLYFQDLGLSKLSTATSILTSVPKLVLQVMLVYINMVNCTSACNTGITCNIE